MACRGEGEATMKLFRRNALSVIFLVPVAIAVSQNRGCATTPEPGPMSGEQVVATLSGNTVQLTDGEAYAFVEPDGSLKGLNIPSGGRTGEWRVSDKGVLCARWNEVEGRPENCDALRYLGEKDYM